MSSRALMPNRGAILAAARAVCSRPELWPVAASLVPSGWWRRWPPLPVPAGSYLRFRLETMYGHDATLLAGDVVEYLEWCRRMRSAAR